MKSRKNNKILKVLKAIGIGGMVLMALSHPAGGAAAIKWVNGASDRKKFKIQRAEFLKALWYLKKIAREALRRKLKELGFQRLQKSVFVCPWECVDEIIFLRKFFEIEPYVSIILAEAIDNEAAVYRKFDLSTA